jgi:predicted ArsR family transcriptional regulator
MSGNRQQDYLAKHKRIRNKLIETASGDGRACVDVSQLAKQLGMDVRTVRAHLEIMEVDSAGVFMDSTKKQFCTKEGVALLANALKLSETNTR